MDINEVSTTEPNSKRAALEGDNNLDVDSETQSNEVNEFHTQSKRSTSNKKLTSTARKAIAYPRVKTLDHQNNYNKSMSHSHPSKNRIPLNNIDTIHPLQYPS